VIARHLGRLSIAVLATTLVVSIRRTLRRVGPATGSSPGRPTSQGHRRKGLRAVGGRGGFQLKIQVLKDVPPDRWQLVMQYVAASLGVQCNYRRDGRQRERRQADQADGPQDDAGGG
jgi:hypothetical protein